MRKSVEHGLAGLYRRRRRAPRETLVRAQRRGMQAGAEVHRIVAAGSEVLQQRVEPRRVTEAVGVQGADDVPAARQHAAGVRVPVARVQEFIRDDRVEDLHAVGRAAVADHPGEVVGRVVAARRGRRAGIPEHACLGGQPGEVERRLRGRVMRQHGVQDQLVDVPRVRDGVARRREGAVRDTVDDHLPHAQRLPEQVEVGHGLVCRVKRRAVAEDPRALGDRVPGRRRDVRTAHLRLQTRAPQSAELAGAALVERDEPVVLGQLRHALGGQPGDEADAALARAAGQEQQHAFGRIDVVGRRDLQVEGSGDAAVMVERDGQRRAGEPGLARARV